MAKIIFLEREKVDAGVDGFVMPAKLTVLLTVLCNMIDNFILLMYQQNQCFQRSYSITSNKL
jgi:hypothetical protein